MDKQLKPQLRFPEFTSSWENKYIKSIAKVVGGGTPSTTNDEYWNGEINWFTPTEIKCNVVSESNRKITELGLNNSSATILPKGTILLTTRATIGEVAIAQEECTTNQGFQSLIVNKSNSNQFVFDLIKVYRNELYKRANGSTFKEISKKEIEKINILIPQLPEQQKIASFLSDVDAKITQLTKKKDLLEQYKKGIMQKIFSQKLRFKDDNGNAFPKWEIKKLGNVFSSFKGKGIPKGDVITVGNYKCVLYGELYTTYNEVINKVVSSTNSEDGLRSKKGDLLIPSSTTTTGIDLANVTALNFENILLGGDIIVMRGKKEINNVFYAYYLSNFKKHQIASRAQGITIVHIYFNSIKDLEIDVPVVEEQTKIANFLSDIDVKIEALNTKIEHSKSFKKGLLQQMFV